MEASYCTKCHSPTYYRGAKPVFCCRCGHSFSTWGTIRPKELQKEQLELEEEEDDDGGVPVGSLQLNISNRMRTFDPKNPDESPLSRPTMKPQLNIGERKVGKKRVDFSQADSKEETELGNILKGKAPSEKKVSRGKKKASKKRSKRKTDI